MKIGILGTGSVGRAHAEKLLSLGHEVVIGTNDIQKTLARTESDETNTPPFVEWLKQHNKAILDTFQNAASHGEIVINALKGEICIDILNKAGEKLANKILIDISNPLDSSKGGLPTLFICNTDSLAEKIQRTFPQTKVVKAFNTLTAKLQTNPHFLMNGDHHLFISGNNDQAKEKVIELARSYGWRHILDLGDITTARGPEMFLPLWLRIWTKFNTSVMNIKIMK